jgi:hydrogenase expression/formation protein HypD
LEIMRRAFDVTEGNWRGIGKLDNSALQLKTSLAEFDARKKYSLKPQLGKDIHAGCQCHQVIVGKIKPNQCSLFLSACTPAKPVGACMVSSEGTCRVWAKNVAAKNQ